MKIYNINLYNCSYFKWYYNYSNFTVMNSQFISISDKIADGDYNYSIFEL